jgi:SAM-dependent methyltransferase
MQVTSGIRALLGIPLVYRLTMRLLRNEANRQWFIDAILAPAAGDKVIDFGCGPARILDRLHGVDYIGLDISDAYIEEARRRYRNRGMFLSGSLADWRKEPRLRGADLFLCDGVLHHVDDPVAEEIIRLAHASLKPGGRFVFYEPCYLRYQSRMSAFFMARDRGQNIRTEDAWKRLAAHTFAHVSTHIVTGVNRLGYVCIVGECIKHTE